MKATVHVNHAVRYCGWKRLKAIGKDILEFGKYGNAYPPFSALIK
jgi:hypothetical protein